LHSVSTFGIFNKYPSGTENKGNTLKTQGNKVTLPKGKQVEAKLPVTLTATEMLAVEATKKAQAILGVHAIAWCVTHKENGEALKTPRYRVGVPLNLFSAELQARWKVRENGNVIWGIGSSFNGAITSAIGCKLRYPTPPQTLKGEYLWEPPQVEATKATKPKRAKKSA
jgi:hypothetical protein